VTSAPNDSAAQQLRLDLQAGALPAELDVDSGTTYYLQPSLATEFKTFSVLAGLAAMFAVAGVVFARYRQPGVALPMVLTAASEVYILLGFAAAVGLALDLSHIAGFIAVIGTGVDDLVIIADEILQSGDVKTGRVFQSRFRKAFWVIGAAAATTIVALSPLAVLSLGDLQGFAIVTIVGVLVGVLITRPAYGDILRNVVLD
jgi:preprotein translocase subunit SecD